MKRLLLILSLTALITSGIAQVPQGINYQAVARDAADAIIISTAIEVQISIMEGGVTLYSEDHSVMTGPFGVFQLVIGTGDPTMGFFTSIDWSSGAKEVNTKIDFGSGYIDMGTAPMWSVPFALYAAASPETSLWQESGSTIYRETDNVAIGNTYANNKLDVRPDSPSAFAGIDLVNKDATGDVGMFIGVDSQYNYGIGVDNSIEDRFEIVRGLDMDAPVMLVMEQDVVQFEGNPEIVDQCGIFVDDPHATLHVGGDIIADNLVGPGTARLVASDNGVITRGGLLEDHLFLNGLDFVGNNVVYEVFDVSVRGSNGSDEFLYCPVHLPDGATITGMEMFATDNNVNKNLRAELDYFQVGIASTVGAFGVLLTSTMGAPGRFSYVDVSPTNNVVDNELNTYLVQVVVIGGDMEWNSSDLILHGLRIDYIIE